MNIVYLLLGSNLGERKRYLESASARLVGELLPECMHGKRNEAVKCSSVYETEPWGFESENRFLNAVIVLSTPLSPWELLDATRLIEIEMGRIGKSDGSYHDRIIDIDLLMVDDQVIRSERLTLPHPLMRERRFVMEPLAEVAPDTRHP